MGWAINKDKRGYVSVSHNGGMGGVSTSLHLIPSEGIVVAVLANGSKPFVYSIHDDILSALLPAYAERRAVEEAQTKPAEVEQTPFAAVPELMGDWTGMVHTYHGDLPLTLSFKPYDDVHIQLGAQLKTLLSDVKFRDGRLKGYFAGDIGTEDANRNPYRLHLDLKLRGQTLNGAVLAVGYREDGEGGVPGRRMGNAVAHWAELTK